MYIITIDINGDKNMKSLIYFEQIKKNMYKYMVAGSQEMLSFIKCEEKFCPNDMSY